MEIINTMNTTPAKYKVITNSINSFSSPSNTGTILKQIPYGTTLEILEQSILNDKEVWGYYKEKNNKIEYVPLREIKGNVYLTPIEEPQDDNNAVSLSIEEGTYTIIVPNINIRTAPSLTSPIACKYSKGQKINFSTWAEIKDGLVWGRFFTPGGYPRYAAVRTTTGIDYAVKD